MKNLILTIAVLGSTQAFAWGGRGHNGICMAAALLVQEKGLQGFMKMRPHVMGHVCNIPDTYWRSVPGGYIGTPAHYVDPEIIGIDISKIPLDYAKMQTEYTGKDNKAKPEQKIASFATEFGSNWWRVDQFYNRIVGRKAEVATMVAPKGFKQEQDDNLPYNKLTFDMMVDMALMGHFVGDASQPMHNTVNHDGWMTGNGGLHGYYEETTVAEESADLQDQIVQRAKKIKKANWLDKKPVLERMRDFSTVAAAELPKMLKIDPKTKPSELKKEKGMEIREPAVRKSPAEGWKVYREMALNDMARSARLLAQLWDEAYVELGRPDLSAYKSYRFPFTPDFIPPNYFSPDSKEAADIKANAAAPAAEAPKATK